MWIPTAIASSIAANTMQAVADSGGDGKMINSNALTEAQTAET
jgi:hypothetical protein